MQRKRGSVCSSGWAKESTKGSKENPKSEIRNLKEIRIGKLEKGGLNPAYYHDHQAEMDAQIERSARDYERLKAQAGETPLQKRLKELGKLR